MNAISMPSLLCVYVFFLFTSLYPKMKFSRGFATRSSTSADVAPGYTATHAPWRTVNCGISCFGIVASPSIPRSTSIPISNITILWLHIAASMNDRFITRLGFLVRRALMCSRRAVSFFFAFLSMSMLFPFRHYLSIPLPVSTLIPSDTFCWPFTITWSPGFSPDRIIIPSPSKSPVSTRC